jgi:hypothetical protein
LLTNRPLTIGENVFIWFGQWAFELNHTLGSLLDPFAIGAHRRAGSMVTGARYGHSTTSRTPVSSPSYREPASGKALANDALKQVIDFVYLVWTPRALSLRGSRYRQFRPTSPWHFATLIQRARNVACLCLKRDLIAPGGR